MTRPARPADFERRFAAEADPWGCRVSRFEGVKRRRALAPFRGLAASALDVACGDGAATRALAARTLRVDAVDAAPSALASARAHCAGATRVRLRLARAPDGLPRGLWRRILVSEIAYYLDAREIDRLADALCDRLAPGGRLVAVHHLARFADAATPPAVAADRLARRLGRRLSLRERRRFGRYERLVCDRPTPRAFRGGM